MGGVGAPKSRLKQFGFTVKRDVDVSKELDACTACSVRSPLKTRNCEMCARCSQRLNSRPRHRSSTALLGTLRSSCRHRLMLGSSVPNDSVTCPHSADGLDAVDIITLVVHERRLFDVTCYPHPTALCGRVRSTREWRVRPRSHYRHRCGHENRHTTRVCSSPLVATNPASFARRPSRRDKAGAPLSQKAA